MSTFLDPRRIIPGLYYRDDDSLLGRVLGKQDAVQVVVGLRRFGKTSFLHRIRARCGEPENREKWYTTFHRAEDEPDDFLDGLERARVEYLREQEDERKRTCLVLIDDLIALDGHFEKMSSELDKVDFLERLGQVFSELIETAKDSDGKLKLILSEPTNFKEWLRGDFGEVGKLMPREVRVELVQEDNPERLNSLTFGEAYRLLLGVVDNNAQLPDVTEELATHVHQETGGNPWLLAHAQAAIRSKRGLLDASKPGPDGEYLEPGVALVQHMHTRIYEMQEEEAVDTIFNSLARVEQFILRFLVEMEEQQQKDARTLPRIPWRTSTQTLARRMTDMGLINCTNGVYPTRVRSAFIKKRLQTLCRDQPVTRSEEAWIIESWEEVLLTPHPTKQAHKTGIIHQFSDVFFHGQGLHDAWRAYENYLRSLPPHERPHLIVFCGNVLAATDNRDTWNSFAGHMEREIKRLLNARCYEHDRPLVQPARGMGFEPQPEQIVVVPGIYDLCWDEVVCQGASPSLLKEQEAKLQTMLGAPGALAPRFFPLPNLVLIPLNTVAVHDVPELEKDRERLGRLVETRALLARRFQECWDGNGVARDKTKDFLRNVLFYSHDGVAQNGLPDFGFVSRGSLEGMLGQLEKVVDETPQYAPLRIAVSHHLPQQHDPTNDQAFRGYLELRRSLVRNGVHMLLHGHSPLQTCLSETSRKWGGTTSPFHMVGSGSFWPTADPLGQGRSEDDPPTFNIIRIEAQNVGMPKGHPVSYQVEIRFGEIVGERVETSQATQLTLGAS